MSKLRSHHRHAAFGPALAQALLASIQSPEQGNAAAADLGTKLETFRQLMLDAKEFSEIHDYFHDELVADPSFMPASRPASNKRLVEILEHIIKRCGSTLRQPRLLQVPEHKFWHGCLQLGVGHMVVMYFESIDFGLCCYCRSLADPRVDFFRFSAVEVPADGLQRRARPASN